MFSVGGLQSSAFVNAFVIENIIAQY